MRITARHSLMFVVFLLTARLAIAAPIDSVKITFTAGAAGSGDIDTTVSGSALGVSVVEVVFDQWDPTLNGGNGDWKPAGKSFTYAGPAGGNYTYTNTTLVFTSGIKYRATATLTRGGVTKATDTSTIVAP